MRHLFTAAAVKRRRRAFWGIATRVRHRRRAHGSMPVLRAVELVRERAELAVPVVLHDLLLQARHLQEKCPPSRAAVRG